MNERQDMTKTASKSAKQAQEQEQAIRPLVDIFEDNKGITVQADMPGVSKDRLDIQIDSDSLTIKGEAAIPMSEGMEAIYADVRSTRYERSFSLSSELDAENADATLKDGVLTLRIPKREQYQPRKIEVRTG